MPAIINSSNQIELQGNATGWSRAKIAMPTPPSGTNDAIYVMRYWLDTFPTDTLAQDTVTHDPAQHTGFNFNSSHPDAATVFGTGDATGTFRDVYRDFFGMGHVPLVPLSLDFSALTTKDTDAARDEYALLAANSVSDVWQGTHYGNGDTDFYSVTTGSGPTTSKQNIIMPITIPANPTKGQETTYIWHVYTDEDDERVYMKMWVNTDSINLDSFNIENDLDPTDPTAFFPVSDSWETLVKEMNGAADTGGNWRPSSGVMAFPTYYNARFSHEQYKMVIDYVGVHYSERTVT